MPLSASDLNIGEHLTSSQYTLVTLSLRVAAEQFDKDAETAAAVPRTKAQFEQQAAQARELIDIIERHELIVLAQWRS
jgi:hypothetical protein